MLPENAGKTFGDYLDARPNAALQTAIATAVGGGAQVATVKAAGWAVNRADYQAEKARQAELRTSIDAIVAAGLRDKVRILVGGAPLNERFAHEIGADGYVIPPLEFC